MKMSNKSTHSKLIEELHFLKERIEKKLKAMYLYKKLPYDRLAKGRQLGILVESTIQHLEKWEMQEAKRCLEELAEKGLKIKNKIT